MDYERENQKLRACLREIYRSFHYGPVEGSTSAPYILRMIEEALGWPQNQSIADGSAGASVSIGATGRGGSVSGAGNCTYVAGTGIVGGGGGASNGQSSVTFAVGGTGRSSGGENWILKRAKELDA